MSSHQVIGILDFPSFYALFARFPNAFAHFHSFIPLLVCNIRLLTSNQGGRHEGESLGSHHAGPVLRCWCLAAAESRRSMSRS